MPRVCSLAMRDLDSSKSQAQSPFASASLKSVTFWGFLGTAHPEIPDAYLRSA